MCLDVLPGIAEKYYYTLDVLRRDCDAFFCTSRHVYVPPLHADLRGGSVILTGDEILTGGDNYCLNTH